MRIDGTSNMSGSTKPQMLQQDTDDVSKNLQERIQNAQNQLQQLSQNKDMSMEEKMNKRKELNKQISELNNELRQHQMELRKQRQAEARKATENALGSTEKKSTDIDDAVSSMISADTALKLANAKNKVATTLKGRTGVLKAEIETDKVRGVDTTKKENELSKITKNATRANAAQVKMLHEAKKEIDHFKVDKKEKDDEDKNKEQEQIATTSAKETNTKAIYKPIDELV